LLDLSDGEIEWTYRGKLHRSGAGGLMLMEPGEVHANPYAVPACDFRALFIAPALMQTAAMELGMESVGPHLTRAGTSDAETFRVFARFHASLEGEASLLERESRLASCIRLLLVRYGERTPTSIDKHSRPALRRVRDLIREHYARPIGLGELVAASGLSRYYLVRAFAKEFGLPPHAYQVHVQIARSQALLAAGASLVFAGTEVGFSDQSHFTRHFKRSVGVTPGLYRREMVRR
jgi:AraC-like DNA-binding protein